MENSPLYKLRFLPLLLGVITLAMGLAVFFISGTGTSTLTLGIFMSVFGVIFLRFIQMRQTKERAVAYSQTADDYLVTFSKPASIKIDGFGDECPEIIIAKDECILLMFQMFPPENEALLLRVPDDFTARLSAFLGVNVHHEDRELFRIDSNTPHTIQRVQDYFSCQTN